MPVTRFANLADAANAVAALLQRSDVAATAGESHPALVAAILPNGAPGAVAVAEALDVGIVAVRIEVRPEGVAARIESPVAGRTVIVVDDGVETGTAARATAAALRAAGASQLVLAVPVCSREAQAGLAPLYDVILAVVQPLGRRDLRWHFDDFDTINEAAARLLLEGSGRLLR